MEWMDFTSIGETSAIMYGVFGLILTYILRDVDKWPKRLCIMIIVSSIAVSTINLIQKAGLYYHIPLPACWVIMCVSTPIIPIPTLLVLAYFLHCCGEDYRKAPVMRIMCALTVLLVLSQYVGYVVGQICITPSYEVTTGSWKYYYIALIAALWIINLFALLKRWKKPTLIQWLFFMLCLFLPAYLQGILVELLLMISLVRNYLTEQEEAAKQRTHIAVLQMRPHFIHNTLMSIYYLCAQNPEKAQTVIKDFSRYLQSNFTAIAKEGMIPFTEELEHTRAYLAVEQARFEGQLFVEFDTPDTFFRIPPLTLQPIVENAVKHGIDPDMEPLIVSVVTENTAQGVRIIVEDTGPGYVPTGDSESHFALENIRERLKILCRGTLEIAPREAGGTKVTVFVPKQ